MSNKCLHCGQLIPPPSKRGQGRLYRPKHQERNGTTRESRIWWIDLGYRGRQYRLSTKTRDYDEAAIVLEETKRRLRTLFSLKGKVAHD